MIKQIHLSLTACIYLGEFSITCRSVIRKTIYAVAYVVQYHKIYTLLSELMNFTKSFCRQPYCREDRATTKFPLLVLFIKLRGKYVHEHYPSLLQDILSNPSFRPTDPRSIVFDAKTQEFQ